VCHWSNTWWLQVVVQVATQQPAVAAAADYELTQDLLLL
jgi:hypothetical protein